MNSESLSEDIIIKDIDGNTYETVVIGSQTWMASNLMTTRYRDGTVITRGPTTATWNGNDNGYYAYPPRISTDPAGEETLDNIKAFKLGFVYQQSTTTNSHGLCPTGWHVPTDAEFTILAEYVGTPNCDGIGSNYGYFCSPAGSNLKQEGDYGMSSWNYGNGTNTVGFSAVGAGFRETSGSYHDRKVNAFFWSSSPTLLRRLKADYSGFLRDTGPAAWGSSVRCLKDDETVVDVDGNAYETVVIGSQTWMASNLMTTRYRDGTVITRGPTTATWNGNNNGYYAYPPNAANNAEESLANIITNKLGFVYQQSTTTNARGLCPTHWHVPTDAEFKILAEHLGGINCDGTGASYGWFCDSAGASLKQAGTTNWSSGNTGTNTSGFSAVGAGFRGTNGSFNNRLEFAFLWSSSSTLARALYYTGSRVNRYTDFAAYGFSVRCLKD